MSIRLRRRTAAWLALLSAPALAAWLGVTPAPASHLWRPDEAERRFIAAHPVLRYYADPDSYPFYLRDKHGGSPHGLAVDYLDYLYQRTGMRSESVAFPSRAAAWQAFGAGQIDLIVSSRPDDDDDTLLRTVPILTEHTAIVARKAAPGPYTLEQLNAAGMTLAVQRNSGMIWELRQCYPAIRLMIFDEPLAAYREVVFGDAQALIDNASAADLLLRWGGNQSLATTATTPIDISTFLGVHPSQPVLAAIIDQVIGGMGAADAARLRHAWPPADTLVRISWREVGREGAPFLALAAALVAAGLVWGWHLVKARRLAEHANQVKADFLAVMSHELRSPLYAVLGNLQLLAKTGLAAEQRRFLDSGSSAAAILLLQIDDLIDFARIDAGKLTIVAAPCHPVQAAERVIELALPRAQEKGLYLRLEVGEGLPWIVQADEVRLRQVLLNLVVNAIKFTERGGVTLALAAGVTGPGVCDLYFTVRDTGMGISAKAAATLFQPFVQVDSSSTRQQGGAGLGLAICRRLAALMQAQVWLDSTPGAGTTVVFRLPAPVLQGTPPADFAGLVVYVVLGDVATARLVVRYLGWSGVQAGLIEPQGALPEQAPDLWIVDDMALTTLPASDAVPVLLLTDSPRPLRVQAAIPPEPMLPGRLLAACEVALGLSVPDQDAAARLAWSDKAGPILVAEDHPGIRALIADQLHALGFHCELVQNGGEALLALARGRYALLLTDCHMPDMDGPQLSREVRAREAAGHRLPIVGLSADVLETTVERARQAGMDAYLRKPATLEELGAALDRFLLRPALPPEAPSAHADLRGMYLDALRDDLAGLHATLTQGLTEPARQHAHRIRGAAQYMRDDEVAAAAQRVEQLAQGLDLDALAQAMARLDALVRHTAPG